MVQATLCLGGPHVLRIHLAKSLFKAEYAAKPSEPMT
jgi:hypothetical protein